MGNMEEKKKTLKPRFTIRRKIILLSLGAAIPFVVMLIYLLVAMRSYSDNYDKIVRSMTVANNYNLNFKEQMDESLYKLVVGYVTFENIDEDKSLRNPYDLIEETNKDFSELLQRNNSEEGEVWLRRLLKNTDTLKKRVDDIRESLKAGDNYDANIQMLESDIYVLTELIQDDIQYFMYYQTRAMEQVNNSLNDEMGSFIRATEFVVILLIVLVVFAAVAIVTGILRPLRSLNEATVKMSDGDFSARAKVNSHDEIMELADSFNYMASNMEDMVDEIKEDQQKMRKADLRLLQEQINPHFLYNTLDTIVWLIEANESDQAVEMVVTLSNFFRIVLSKGKEFISIREEEQHIRSYLAIQEMRYHDIMEYDIQIDQVLYDYQIPKLTLQPIVENALYHGLKVKRAKGFIHILGEIDGDKMHLIVRDNGVGMEAEELDELREEISRPCKETEKGFGLANVNERIRMYFGPEYGMTVESQKGKGTEVELILPVIKAVVEENE